MVKGTDESVLERIMRLEPQSAVVLDAVDDKVQLELDLERIVDFLHRHELRPGDSKFSHINYQGIAKTWYSSLSGRYAFPPEALPMLYASMVKVAGLGIPLQLVECKDGRLSVFPLHFDIDIKLASVYDPEAIEKEMVDAAGGFRFFKAIAGALRNHYNSLGDIVVFTASGTTRASSEVVETISPQKKVSFRIVFPEVVVDKERGQLIWQTVSSKLMSMSADESQFPYMHSLLKRLRQLSAANESFMRVVDESVIRCKHGVRMPFSDKVEKSRSAGRVLKPLIILRFEREDENATVPTMIVVKRPTGTDDGVEWLEKGALSTPSLRHALLTDWTRPNVKTTSRVTKTGASGSSLALARLTAVDAARAAERANNRRTAAASDSEPMTSSFLWEDGTTAEFKRKLVVGIDRNFDEDTEGFVVWRNPRRPSDFVSFNAQTKIISLSAGNQLRADNLKRALSDIQQNLRVSFGDVERAAPKVVTVDAANKRMTVIANFVATDEGEVSIAEGDIVTMLEIGDQQWSYVEKADLSKGYVPFGFLEPLA